MSYSCRYFIHEDDTLYQIQVNKVDYFCLTGKRISAIILKKEKTMFNESFLRTWDLYLSACDATFHNGIVNLHQLLITKEINNELPMTR